tara:strand:- start:39 stop:371 length:333 start_codon:yes stop_codon:yes gene_type:complete
MDGGKDGTPHLQIYFQLKEAQSWTFIRKLFGDIPIWFQGAYSSPDACIAYCQKEGDWIQWGEKFHTGPRARWHRLMDTIKKGTYTNSLDLLTHHPDFIPQHRTITELLHE